MPMKFLSIFLFFTILLFSSCGKNNNKTESNENLNKDKQESVQQNKDEAKSEPSVLKISDNDKIAEIQCSGMTCGACERTIVKKIKKIDGITDVIADYKTNTVKASYNPSKTTPEVISEAITSSGYKVLHIK